MGSSATEAGNYQFEKPQHEVFTDRFEIMAYEVTNLQYAQCVRAGICFGAGSSVEKSNEKIDHPVSSVSWEEAQAYCAYAGGRLPSEAEWEKAARGGLEAMPYPWGNSDPICQSGADHGALSSDCNLKDALPVGSFQPNGFGVYDMAGNVWEWVADWYDAGYYSISPASNPIGPELGEKRAIRGGSWGNNINFLRVAFRYSLSPEQRSDVIGFRCVRIP